MTRFYDLTVEPDYSKAKDPTEYFRSYMGRTAEQDEWAMSMIRRINASMEIARIKKGMEGV